MNHLSTRKTDLKDGMVEGGFKTLWKQMQGYWGWQLWTSWAACLITYERGGGGWIQNHYENKSKGYWEWQLWASRMACLMRYERGVNDNQGDHIALIDEVKLKTATIHWYI